MRAVVQRVIQAKVSVENEDIGKIDKGLLIYLAVGENDEEKDLEYMVNKIVGLRIFEDENGKMNLSVKDIEGQVLVISQFTLYGDVRKGKRPNFMASAKADKAEKLYEEFIELVKKEDIVVQNGKFAAHMEVDYINDGPVTILLDSDKIF